MCALFQVKADRLIFSLEHFAVEPVVRGCVKTRAHCVAQQTGRRDIDNSGGRKMAKPAQTTARPTEADVIGLRRSEILETAALVLATSGLRTSMREIADAAGLLKGSLYHHFESKDAILVELVRRYYDDLDRVAERALDRLARLGSASVIASIEQLGSDIAHCAVAHRAALQMTFYDSPSSLPELAELLRHPRR